MLCESFPGGEKIWFRSCRAFLGPWSFLRWSVIPGIFKGFNNMKPYAISQIAIEQVIRVVWMLLTTTSLWRLAQETMLQAVVDLCGPLSVWGQAFWCSFITLQKQACSLLFLESKREWRDWYSGSLDRYTIHWGQFPFIITGSIIQALQIVDQMTFINVSCLGSQIIVKSSSWSCLVISLLIQTKSPWSWLR